jgi:GxxExxY protein
MIDVEQLKDHVYDIVGALHTVHDELGPGINEYCYQEAFAMELADRGIPFEKEKTFHPTYKGRPMNAEYRIDFLCKGDVVVECKAVSGLSPSHRAQLFNYMRLLKLPCGIIVNWFPKFAAIERYFYDDETQEILTVEGVPFQYRTPRGAAQ